MLGFGAARVSEPAWSRRSQGAGARAMDAKVIYWAAAVINFAALTATAIAEAGDLTGIGEKRLNVFQIERATKCAKPSSPR